MEEKGGNIGKLNFNDAKCHSEVVFLNTDSNYI